ncbi:putative domain containing protein [Neofusicoccum parvum UCRNP2]|uniref:Putative domain containing protein n=1 Tax=Botryosphaeria parva (strain UCR-NP2) TaxID=1287680 RepID=R1EV04_BOTPV|nr:putative domain containing protein [Neofusicoccum parvum UCRNP2]
MNPTNASQQSSRTHLTPESSLRPRNKQRLLSGLDDEPGRDPNAQASLEGSRAASPAASPYASRTASPIPGAGPSRSSSQQQVSRSRESTVSKGALGWASPGGSAQDPLAQLSGLWGSSWSTLQGLASNVLGSDASGDVPRKRRPFEATHGRKATTSAPPAQWGPAERDTQIGSGTKEEREAMVRAMKRKDLLMANGHLNMDATGKFKRRNSDERISSSAPPTEHDDRDALVYIHRVRPEDTLAGITIKYNCQAATLRKSNRILTFSDNDSAVRTPSASLELNRSDTHGPGGVGTFNRNVRKPGPAQDGLNKIFSQHLPNLAPPPGKDYFGTWNPAQLAEAKANGDSMGPSGTATPVGVGGVGGSSTGFDFEQVGGAIEGWMRKVATKASTLVPPAPLTPGKSGVTAADRQRAAGAGLGAAGMGGDINDLIELTDAFEVGDDDEEEETNRGRASSGSGRRGPADGVRRREARSGTPSKGAKGD